MKYLLLLYFTAVTLFFTSCNISSGNHAVKDSSINRSTASTSDSVLPVGSPFVYGIDISKYQGDEIDLMNRKGDSLSFVICKATEGLTLTDKDFKTNWVSISAKGFTKGTYHFYHCKDDPYQQADHFISIVGNFEQPDFPPIVDFEEESIDPGFTKKDVQSGLILFLEELEKRTGRQPLLYTDNNTSSHYLSDTKLASYPLYIAHYESAPPVLQGPWKGKRWVIWQKMHTYSIGSFTNDFDIFNGSAAELSSFLQQR